MQDLAGLDVDVERAFVAWTRFRRDLARDPEAHADVDVFAARRVTANKSTRDALLAATPSIVEVPLRDALARWVAFLVVARLGQADDVAFARAAAEEHGVLHIEPVRRVSAREARRALVAASARSRAEASLWLDALAETGPLLAPIVRERSARRAEAFTRLGLEGAAPLAPASTHALDALAHAILDATRDVAREALRDARKRADLTAERPSPVDAVRAALAREAGDGWPARLAKRWLGELFAKDTRGLALDFTVPTAALGASSFVRALHEFGAALRRSGARGKGARFALRADPEPVDAYRVGGAFAALGAASAFHRRALGLGARVAAGQARSLGATLLFELRKRAVAWLLARDASRGTFEELTTELFGAPLPATLAGAWPFPEDDVASRLLGAADAAPLEAELRERYDEDWFRNPRAFAELRARASLPLYEPPHEIDAAAVARRLAASAEAVLG